MCKTVIRYSNCFASHFSQVCVRQEEGYCSICWQGCQDTTNVAPNTVTPATNTVFETNTDMGADGTDGCLDNTVSTAWLVR